MVAEEVLCLWLSLLLDTTRPTQQPSTLLIQTGTCQFGLVNRQRRNPAQRGAILIGGFYCILIMCDICMDIETFLPNKALFIY